MELCIDFGGTEIKLAAIDGRILASDSIPVGGGAGDLDAAATAARALVERIGRRADAVGIAVPGVVDPTTGRMLHANAKYDHLRDFDLDAWSRREFGVGAVVENDARAALIGETSTGSAAGERDAVLVTLGTGIGTAAMIDGIPLRGRTGHAGILGGHVTIDIDGPECPCGNTGCGEALASAWALREHHATPAADDDDEQNLTVRDLFERPELHGIRERFLRVWGATVVTLVHLHDPAVVILSGGILRAGDAVLLPIEEYVRTHLWPSMTPPRFIMPPQPEFSVVRGLSALAAQRRRPHQEEK